MQADEASKVAKEIPKSVTSDGELESDMTGQAEHEQEKELDEVSYNGKAAKDLSLTFAEFLNKIKANSREPSPVLENTSDGKDELKEEESLPRTALEAENSSGCLEENILCSDEGVFERGSHSPDKSKEDLLVTSVEKVESSVEEVDGAEVMGDLHEKRESDAGILREEVKKDEERQDVESLKEEQNVLAKDSTDDEEIETRKDDDIQKSEEDDCFIPETQQSQNVEASVKADDDLFISPTKAISGSLPSILKLSLTPVIKLQKLNDADLLRLSPDPSKCTFSRLDINSSPKVFTSSEDEPTPNRFASRLRQLQSDGTPRSNASKKSLKPTAGGSAEQNSKAEVLQKRATRRKSQMSNKRLQSSQADLAELAERFELDGIQPLDDETDMDQSLDQIDNDSQLKRVLNEPVRKDGKVVENSSKEDHVNQTRSKGQRKDRGKKQVEVCDEKDMSFLFNLQIF